MCIEVADKGLGGFFEREPSAANGTSSEFAPNESGSLAPRGGSGRFGSQASQVGLE